ncbi:MAG: hypothetical protein E7643_03940 [Ruminococcaceae bacterium]|nr:hypothetical protein [Oscillospiraceae bacterium]
MGKGKRNRQLHLEDKLANPERYKEEKKPFRMPKWATRTICIAVLVLVVAAIVLTAMVQNGVFLRTQVLVNSTEGYKLNRQMASFIVWQSLYQQGYQDWYYAYYGLTEDTNKITETYSSPSEYGIMYAAQSTTSFLRDVIDSSADYLAELVAGADAGVKAGFVLDEYDQIAIDEMVDWIKNLQKNAVPDASLNSFLGVYVGKGVTETDVRDAAELMAMYTKYCDYVKFDMDKKPSKNTLLTFIAENPANHYEAVYRAYKAESEAEAKKFEGVKTEAEFTALVVDILMEKNLNALLISHYATPDANADKDALNTAKKAADAKDKVPAKLKELGIVSADYKATSGENNKIVYSPEIKDEALSSWIFDSNRKKDDFGVVTGESSVYLVYAFSAPVAKEDSTTIKTGWKEYKLSDYADETKNFAENLKKDLISEKREDTTAHKSSEDLAKALLEAVKKDKLNVKDIDKKAYTVTAVKTGVTTTKPESSSSSSSSSSTSKQTAPDAILDALYESGEKIEKGGYYQADDGNGNSYVVQVTNISGTTYTVDYATVEDSTYYSIFRSIKTKMDSAYPLTAPTLAHPDLTTDADEKTVTFEEWMCEATLTEATKDAPATLTFKRAANDVKWFKTEEKTTTTGSTTLTKPVYTAYIVVTPMKAEKEDTEATAYAGYLKYNSKADAEVALSKIQGLTGRDGFDLWHAFKSLSVTTKAKVEGEEDTVTNATIETNIKKTTTTVDEKVRDWFFTEGLAKNSLKVIEGKDGSFYLAYFKSASDTVTTREIKDEWVVSEMTNHINQLIKDGGYKLDEATLEKLGDPLLTEEETTTAAK